MQKLVRQIKSVERKNFNFVYKCKYEFLKFTFALDEIFSFDYFEK
jgi:hypothetical protein